MSRIEIGRANGRAVTLDIETLLGTRLLVQANSGGGKSWLLRLLAEQLIGKVPVFIVDPEGEFATLRERFPFVLVGKGGETPADPRSAELAVHTFLKHGASAVFDLYDLKPQARHHYVRVLLEALVNAPKEIWRPVVVMLDEAHLFAPEKGQGESEAFGAVQDVVTRGRKRGVCPVLFTQRLAKLSKNVSAECRNRLVGQTFEGLDVDRVVETLSVGKDQREGFRLMLKNLEPGEFFGLGAAISKDLVRLRVGRILTTHPEAGTAMAATPPPAPEKIKALLPKLADLPKEADTKAKTEAELRAEVRSLKAQLAARPKEIVAAPAKVQTKVVEVSVIKPTELVRVERALAAALQVAGKIHESVNHLRGFSDLIQKRVQDIERKARSPQPVGASIPSVTGEQGKVARATMPLKRWPTVEVKDFSVAPNERDTTVSRPQLKILQAMAMFEALGFSEIPRTWIAPLADTTHKSSGFEKNVSTLKTGGYVDAGQPGNLRMRPEGRGEVGNLDAPTPEAVLHKCGKAVSGPQANILDKLAQVFPRDLSREEIAAAVESTTTSSGFEKNMSTLKTAGMIEYSGQGRARLAAWVLGERKESA